MLGLRVKSADRTGKLYAIINLRRAYDLLAYSLPIPSREEIMNSPMQETGSTSGFTDPKQRAPSPVMDDPSAQLERELAGTHLQK